MGNISELCDYFAMLHEELCEYRKEVDNMKLAIFERQNEHWITNIKDDLEQFWIELKTAEEVLVTSFSKSIGSLKEGNLILNEMWRAALDEIEHLKTEIKAIKEMDIEGNSLVNTKDTSNQLDDILAKLSDETQKEWKILKSRYENSKKELDAIRGEHESEEFRFEMVNNRRRELGKQKDDLKVIYDLELGKYRDKEAKVVEYHTACNNYTTQLEQARSDKENALVQAELHKEESIKLSQSLSETLSSKDATDVLQSQSLERQVQIILEQYQKAQRESLLKTLELQKLDKERREWQERLGKMEEENSNTRQRADKISELMEQVRSAAMARDGLASTLSALQLKLSQTYGDRGEMAALGKEKTQLTDQLNDLSIQQETASKIRKGLKKEVEVHKLKVHHLKLRLKDSTEAFLKDKTKIQETLTHLERDHAARLIHFKEAQKISEQEITDVIQGQREMSAAMKTEMLTLSQQFKQSMSSLDSEWRSKIQRNQELRNVLDDLTAKFVDMQLEAKLGADQPPTFYTPPP